jgi:hypothetical protein
MKLREAVYLWQAEPGWLNIASYGLPPRTTANAMTRAPQEPQRGAGPWAS